jgi:hypothetical protein
MMKNHFHFSFLIWNKWTNPFHRERSQASTFSQVLRSFSGGIYFRSFGDLLRSFERASMNKLNKIKLNKDF